jgi:hypothetical protein
VRNVAEKILSSKKKDDVTAMQMHRNLSQAPEAVANTANLPCEVKCF